MDYDKIIIILVILLVIVIIGGLYIVFSNNTPSNNVNNTTSDNNSSNVTVEKINSEEVSSQSSSGDSGSNIHTVIAEDGIYYKCDDNGNIIEKLGPSKKYYPNDPSAVEYPDAESYYPYMQHQL